MSFARSDHCSLLPRPVMMSSRDPNRRIVGREPAGAHLVRERRITNRKDAHPSFFHDHTPRLEVRQRGSNQVSRGRLSAESSECLIWWSTGKVGATNYLWFLVGFLDGSAMRVLVGIEVVLGLQIEKHRQLVGPRSNHLAPPRCALTDQFHVADVTDRDYVGKTIGLGSSALEVTAFTKEDFDAGFLGHMWVGSRQVLHRS
jgi:hypothetical protein